MAFFFVTCIGFSANAESMFSLDDDESWQSKPKTEKKAKVKDVGPSAVNVLKQGWN